MGDDYHVIPGDDCPAGGTAAGARDNCQWRTASEI